MFQIRRAEIKIKKSSSMRALDWLNSLQRVVPFASYFSLGIVPYNYFELVHSRVINKFDHSRQNAVPFIEISVMSLNWLNAWSTLLTLAKNIIILAFFSISQFFEENSTFFLLLWFIPFCPIFFCFSFRPDVLLELRALHFIAFSRARRMKQDDRLGGRKFRLET